MTQQSFPTQQARVKVRNPAGEVRIETADVEETTVELTALDDSPATREAIEKARIEARGDDVVVEIEGRSWSISIGSWGFGSPKVGVGITCPHGSTVECDTASADTTLRGTFGETRLRSASGDVAVESVEGAFAAKSASGDVRLERVTGPAEVHTVSGDVEVGVALDGVDVNSVSGDVVVGEVTGDLTISSISGDQRVRAAGPGKVALKAVSGDVQIAVRRGLRVRLDVNSVSGSIGSELEVGDAPPAAGGADAELRIRTVSGDVRISRASEIPA